MKFYLNKFFALAAVVLMLTAITTVPASATGHVKPEGSHGHDGHEKHGDGGHKKHGHGKLGAHFAKKWGAHFLIPGVMRTVVDNADSKHRGKIRSMVRKYRAAKKQMASLQSAKKPNKNKIASKRSELDEISNGLSALARKVVEGNKEARMEVAKRIGELALSKHLMHHEDALTKFSQSMGADGDDFVEDFLENRDDLKQLRTKIKSYTAGVDYGKIDKARTKMRDTLVKQQKMLRKAFSENPELRDEWVKAAKKLIMEHHRKNKGHGDEECT
ncbi:MAG: hypothetical protein K8963_02065 [Proteobacteria bacterium]|nr:hypothetical protein [Pseudomonadota bacterium]